MAGGSAGNGPITGLQNNEPKIGMQGKTKSSAKNEAQLYSAALRSSLHGGRAGSGVKGRDERQKMAPLTPLPARRGLVCYGQRRRRYRQDDRQKSRSDSLVEFR